MGFVLRFKIMFKFKIRIKIFGIVLYWIKVYILKIYILKYLNLFDR